MRTDQLIAILLGLSACNEYRLKPISPEPPTPDEVQSQAMDGGSNGETSDSGTIEVSNCSYSRLPLGDEFSFQRTEPGATRLHQISLPVLDGNHCIASVSISGTGFRLVGSSNFNSIEGRSTTLNAGDVLAFGIEFSPLAFGQTYSATIDLPNQMRLRVFGEAAPFCPRLDAGCPIASHELYLSTLDSLFALNGGVRKIGDFTTIDGEREGIKDIATQSDGTMYALGTSLYLVDPNSGTLRRLATLSGNFNGLEAGLTPAQLLVGGEGGVFSFEIATSNLSQIGASIPVSGDIVRLNDGGIAASKKNVATPDSILVLDLQSSAWTLACDLPLYDAWGLALISQQIVGVTNNGTQFSLNLNDCSTVSMMLPGAWTGAAAW